MKRQVWLVRENAVVKRIWRRLVQRFTVYSRTRGRSKTGACGLDLAGIVQPNSVTGGEGSHRRFDPSCGRTRRLLSSIFLFLQFGGSIQLLVFIFSLSAFARQRAIASTYLLVWFFISKSCVICT